VSWAIDEKSYSQRRACALVGLDPETYRYRSRREDDAALRRRLRELASERRRFGHRRLLILLRREGFEVNHERLLRLYREERLTVRKRGGRKRALGTRAPLGLPERPNERWSLDFASDEPTDGRRFRVLVVMDDFSRACPALVADGALSGRRVARELDRLAELRGLPTAIVSDDRAPAGRAIHPRSGRGQETAAGHRAHVARHPPLAAGTARRLARHRRGQAHAERLRREPDRAAPRRMPRRAPVREPPRGASDARAVAERRQRGSAAHETRRTRASHLCQPAHDEPQPQRPLAMSEGNKGARSRRFSHPLASIVLPRARWKHKRRIKTPAKSLT